MKITFHIKNTRDDLKSFLVYKFSCAICSSGYSGETCCHFKTRIQEHIRNDNKSHIFKHLHSTTTCFDSYNYLSFKIIDKANSKFDLKIKEALHINWRKPNLNAQQDHLALIHSLEPVFEMHLIYFLCQKYTWSRLSNLCIGCQTQKYTWSRFLILMY